jgi:hypothetical protein
VPLRIRLTARARILRCMTSTVVPVDPTNAAQSQAWDGSEGDYWAAHADTFEQSMAGYDAAFFAAAAIRP